LLKEGSAALGYVKSFIKDEEIECHMREAGRFRGASKAAHYESIARDLEDLRAVTGIEGHMVSRAEQSEEIGSSLYHGGCVLPGDVSVHPALYHTGLMERAEAAGAILCSHARVERLEETANGMVVHCARGSVKCRDVLIATNGYTSAVTEDLQKKVVPVAAAMIATTELSPNLMAHLMPKQRVYGDTLRVHHYYQPSPDNKRLLFGGRLPGEAETTNANNFEHLRREMTDVFPELDDVPVTHCWSGYVAITSDGLPHIGCASPVYYAMGYNGSGVARASHAGHQVALQILGQADALSAWNELAFERLPFHAFNRLGVRIAITWKRLQDRYS
jgi:glycine/D-amino acid oxidase-like deaminating enzyme